MEDDKILFKSAFDAIGIDIDPNLVDVTVVVGGEPFVCLHSLER